MGYVKWNLKFLKNKWTITVFILIIGFAIFIGIYSLQDEDIVPVDLAVVAKRPVLLYDGVVYRHDENEGWKKLDYNKKIKMVCSDEAQLCVLDVVGKIHCDELPDSSEPGLPLTTAGYFQRAQDALSINEEEGFSLINGHVKIVAGFTALLTDGYILYQELGIYKRFQMEAEVHMLSGFFVLTKSGNVYELIVNESPYIAKEPELKLVYGGGDCVYIDASENALRCVGLMKSGKAMVWSEIDSPDISDWSDLVRVVHGFNYVAGLTSKGKVVFKHYDDTKSAEMEGVFKTWDDIIGIEAYFSSVYGIDKNGEVFVVDFSGR